MIQACAPILTQEMAQSTKTSWDSGRPTTGPPVPRSTRAGGRKRSFLAGLLFLFAGRLGGGLGLLGLGRGRLLGAEDGVIALGELFGFRQAHANDAHNTSSLKIL